MKGRDYVLRSRPECVGRLDGKPTTSDVLGKLTIHRDLTRKTKSPRPKRSVHLSGGLFARPHYYPLWAGPPQLLGYSGHKHNRP